MTPGNCDCNDTAQMFYSAVTLGCLTCGDLILNCASCQRNAIDLAQTDCLSCAGSYYVSSNICVPCDPRCLVCSALLVCSACTSNLVLSGSSCVCDTVTDPSLSYYPITNMCVSCNGLLSNCLVCNPDPLACTTCVNGTYL